MYKSLYKQKVNGRWTKEDGTPFRYQEAVKESHSRKQGSFRFTKPVYDRKGRLWWEWSSRCTCFTCKDQPPRTLRQYWEEGQVIQQILAAQILSKRKKKL